MTRVTARTESWVGALAAAACAAALVGCRGGTATPGESGDLQRDLDAAAASAAFAPPIRRAAPVQFVSALELGAPPAPSSAARVPSPAPAGPTVTPTHARQTAHRTVIVARVREVEAAAPAEVAAAADAPAQVANADAPTSAGAGTYTSPTDVGPAPAPRAGSTGAVGGSSRSGGAGWGAVGGILGAVIRGGAVGEPGHCVRDGRHTRSGYPDEMITGTRHGVIGGGSSGSVIVPIGRVIGAIAGARE